MAEFFGYDLTPTPDVKNLGGLIGAVGPAKELQSNIANIQAAIGSDKSAVEIARGWAIRTAFTQPVERYFGNAEEEIEKGSTIHLAIATGGVRNWMVRRMMRMTQLSGAYNIEQAVLLGGIRKMKPAEGKDVAEGMTESDYQQLVLRPQLENLGIEATHLRVESEVGDEIMAEGAKDIADMVDLADPDCVIALVSNAGAWVQNAGQMRRALRTRAGVFDSNYRNLIAVGDGTKLGKTAKEPPSTHQSPFTTVAQIPRNLQEYARHAA